MCYIITVKPEVVDKHHFVNQACIDCGRISFSTGLEFSSNGDGTCSVIGIGICDDTDIAIPSISPSGDIVTGIGSYAFKGCNEIKNVFVPNTIKTIKSYSFISCKNLTNVVFEDESQLTIIDFGAFSGCSSLTSIKIPAGVTYMGTAVFNVCKSLTSVTFEKNSQLTTIAGSAFIGCTSLTSIEIPANVTYIGASVFNACNALTDVYYAGSEEDWEAISIGIGNDYLTNVTIHYNYVSEG